MGADPGCARDVTAPASDVTPRTNDHPARGSAVPAPWRDDPAGRNRDPAANGGGVPERKTAVLRGITAPGGQKPTPGDGKRVVEPRTRGRPGRSATAATIKR